MISEWAGDPGMRDAGVSSLRVRNECVEAEKLRLPLMMMQLEQAKHSGTWN